MILRFKCADSTSGMVCWLALVIVLLFLPYCLPAQSASDSTWPISRIYAEISEKDSSDIYGKTVTISGTATVSSGVFHERFFQAFIQDTTGGISIFKETIDEPFEVGDSLVVTGKIEQYYGLNEVHVASYEVFPNAGRQIVPASLDEAIKAPEAYMGQLVSGTGVIIEKGTMYNGKYLRIGRTDTAKNTIMAYVSNFHANYQNFDFETPSIGDEVEVTGIISEYHPEYPNERAFQLHLRTTSDFNYAGLPRFYLIATIIGLAVISVFVIGWVATLRSRVKAKTKEIQHSLEEKETLLREIHHRVKNNLAIVAGLLDLQMDNTENEEVHRVLTDGKTRIQSMALIHEKLYATSSLSRINLDTYIEELVEAIHSTYTSYQDPIDLDFNMEDVEVSIDQAIPCGLLINELVTNAYKHAFSKSNKGTLTVSLMKDGESIVLAVADSGPGLPDEFGLEKTDSLGMQLVQTFAAQLSAEISIQNEEGAQFSFTFPVEQ